MNLSLRTIFVTLLLVLVGCSQKPVDLSFVENPELVAVANKSVALTTTIRFTTNKPTKASFLVSDGNTSWVPSNNSDNHFRHKHEIALINFRPDTKHRISVKIEDESGGIHESEAPLLFTTKPFLAGREVPSFIVNAGGQGEESGVIFFTATPFTSVGDQDRFVFDQGAVVALNTRGEIIWYYVGNRAYSNIQVLASGNLLLSSSGVEYIEIDLLGNIVESSYGVLQYPSALYLKGLGLSSKRLDVDNPHSNRAYLPNGNFLVLSTELRKVDTQKIAFNEDTYLLGDVIAEITPAGSIITQWSLFDMLDTQKRGVKQPSPLLEFLYQKNVPRLHGWLGANGIAYDVTSDTMIVTLASQEAIVGIDRASSALQWILDSHDTWSKPWRSKLLSHEKGSARLSPRMPISTKQGTVLFIDEGADGNNATLSEYRIDTNTFSAAAIQQTLPKADFNFIGSIDYATAKDSVGVLYQSHDTLDGSGPYQSHYVVSHRENLVDGLQSPPLFSVASKPNESTGWVVHQVQRANKLTLSSLRTASLTPHKPSKPSQENITGGSSAKPLTTFTSLEGLWDLNIETQLGDEALTLEIKEHKGSVAVGVLDGYDIFLTIKNGKISFNTRRKTPNGRIVYRFSGVVEDKYMEGDLALLSGSTVLAGQTHWRATKVN